MGFGYQHGVPFVGVALGGALGSLLRYLVGVVLPRGSFGLFPWSTLLVNLLGSFLLAFLYFRWSGDLLSPWRLSICVGVMGGFTTYSTFSLDAFALLKDGHHLIASVYLLTTLLGGLVATGLGYWLVRA